MVEERERIGKAGSVRDSETDPRTLITEFQVYTQLLVAGWMPGRSVGGEAVALTGDIAASLTSCGYEVEPSPAAVDFIKEFAFLRVRFTDDPPGRHSVWFDVRDYDEVDAEAIAELSEWLGQPLFPVACGSEGQIALIDPRGRFFLTHWSGDYYLGKSYYEVFACLLTNRHLDLGKAPGDDWSSGAEAERISAQARNWSWPRWNWEGMSVPGNPFPKSWPIAGRLNGHRQVRATSGDE
ncbi:SUKH-3 domain-containing protein [Streptomyces luteireticuli]|uniref:SUKH-3 domain-containing protein n=1 Tax=Streptomyces luteireticuli TaxID=173858 RepID=UPI0035582D4B